MHRAKTQITRAADAAAYFRLIINKISAPKTEYMTIYCQPQSPLNHVNNFGCLGFLMGSSARGQKDLLWTAFWKLEHLWKCHIIPISTKILLFDTNCVTVLLYGCESLTRGGRYRPQSPDHFSTLAAEEDEKNRSKYITMQNSCFTSKGSKIPPTITMITTVPVRR